MDLDAPLVVNVDVSVPSYDLACFTHDITIPRFELNLIEPNDAPQLPRYPSCPGPDALTIADTLCRPTPTCEFWSTSHKLADIYGRVAASKLPNYRREKIPVPHQLNITNWRKNQHKFKDEQLIDFLEFGFPIRFTGDTIPTQGIPNHSLALANPNQVTDFIDTELRFDALIGPFKEPPFREWFRSNPMLTRKRETVINLRVVLDLSFPDCASVNSGIPNSQIDGSSFKLRLPTVQDYASPIASLGPNCLLYKIDLSRTYRQLRSDPLDWAMLGISWDREYFIDTAIPFGLRHGASACQRVTEAVIEVAEYDVRVKARAYIDDTVGAALPLDAPIDYNSLVSTMSDLGLDLAPQKCQPPTTRLTWVGVTFDTVKMLMYIDQQRLDEAVEFRTNFLLKFEVSRKFMERMMGKIFHAIKCTDSAQRFTSRLLALLTRAPLHGKVSIDVQARQDATWLAHFLPRFNRTTVIKPRVAQLVVVVDTCPTRTGGYFEDFGYYHFSFPPSITDLELNIAYLECLNTLFAVRLWIPFWRGKRVMLYCDNAATICAIHSGKPRDPLLQAIVCELWMMCATYDVDLVPRHKPGDTMIIADALSRVHHPEHVKRSHREIMSSLSERQYFVNWSLLSPPICI